MVLKQEKNLVQMCQQYNVDEATARKDADGIYSEHEKTGCSLFQLLLL